MKREGFYYTLPWQCLNFLHKVSGLFITHQPILEFYDLIVPK